MVKDGLFRERAKFFLLGMVLVIGMMFLMGAANETVVIDNGRYQVSAWGNDGAHGAFIVDTISGETKIAYRYKERDGRGHLERDQLGRSFSKIK